MSDLGFVHLHVHSFYSLLDGLARPSDIAATAADLGQKAVALTDHGAMYGIPEFSRACIEKGIKPIIGTEAYITEFGRPMGGRDKMKDKQNYHMLLLAENEIGYKNLIKLSSLAQIEGFYHKPRIDHELLAKYSEGIIATSGCMAAEIPSLLNDEHHTPDEVEAERRLNWYLDVFGRDRYFIEFQEHSIAPLQKLNYKLRQLADRNHVRMIATNDSHYARSTDTLAHDMILCINMQTTLSDTNRMSMATGEYYIKSLDEMKSALSYLDLPDDAFYSTGEIADRCNVNVEYPDFAFPDIKIPDGYTYDTYLEELTWKGAEARYGDRLNRDEVLTNRIKHELNIIKGMKFSVYYLIVGDICAYAQRMGIWWNVRGSGAGSAVAYCTGITRVDPLKYGLIFERFLNPSRHGMPDFDLDFPDDSRESLIAYTMHKYGERSVAQIVSFSTIKSRGAIKDVGRLLGQDPSYMNTLSEMVPFGSSTLENALEESPELALNYQSDANIKNIVDLGMTIEGVKRNMSIHPAAVIITPGDVMNYVPLVKPPASAVTPYVTQFEYPICESLGLLKIDFLGLRTLTIMRIACDLIYKRYGIQYTLDTIPIDGEEADPAFKLLQTGYTLGVFQVESSGMQETLRDMQPTKVEHICAVVSLYRPGPMEYIPTFNKRMRGEEVVEYRHPKMETVMSETYGVCLSGDTEVINAIDGTKHMIARIGEYKDEFYVHGVDENLKPTTARVTKWMSNGIRTTYKISLSNGMQIKATDNHQFLTEYGWKRLDELSESDCIAVPKIMKSALSSSFNLDKLRVIAYLIGDGSISIKSDIDFINKDQVILDEYKRALKVFTDVRVSEKLQIRDVTRVSARSIDGRYETSLLKLLREVGLKGSYEDGGCRSENKFVPSFIFSLEDSEICFFLASLWDCDGHVNEAGTSKKNVSYKTISYQLAIDIHSLLTRLGIFSRVHNLGNYETQSGTQTAYQVNVLDVGKFYDYISPHMVSFKGRIQVDGEAEFSISRAILNIEIRSEISSRGESTRSLDKYNYNRAYIYPGYEKKWPRADVKTALPIIKELSLEDSSRLINVGWEPINNIEYVGEEPVYDIEVERIHNFVANGMIVHNCVYQEQVMQLAVDLAGYSAAESDNMRRAIGKKKEKDLKKHHEMFVEGCVTHSAIDRQVAEDIYSDILKFANYGFNKSHGLDYAVLSVQTAWLKAVYPIEFMAATLSAVKEDIGEVSKFVAESKRMGIDVVTPDVNYSEEQFAINDKNEIVFALSSIKHLKDSTIREIVEERRRKPFRSLEDFCERISLKGASIRGVEVLITSGALDRLRPEDKDVIEWRALLLSSAQDILDYSGSIHRHVKSNQMSWFGDKNGLSLNLTYPPSIDEEFIWKLEGEVLGLMVSHNPVEIYYPLFNRGFTPISLLGEIHEGAKVKTLGLVREVRSIVTKKGDMMGFLTLDDNANSIPVTIFPKSYAKYSSIMKNGNVLMLAGKLDFSRGSIGLIADFIEVAPSLQ